MSTNFFSKAVLLFYGCRYEWMDLTSSFVTFVLFVLCFVNDYSLLVPTDAHTALIYISPYLAHTCFGWSSSSGISQSNS